MKPLPKCNVDVRMSGESRQWSEEQVRAIVCNPIYAGIGAYPASQSDDEWVRGAAKLINEEGAEQFLINLLAVLRASFPAQ
jgi:hypothetical protein